MFRVLGCLGTEHDHRLVLVAGLICFAATITTFRLHACARGARGGARATWLVLTALVAGSGMWAPHFIAMLAYDPGLKTGYEPLGTLSSLAIAASAAAASFIMAATRPRTIIALTSGSVFGLGLAGMHYTGMSAFRTEGSILWDKDLVGASLVLGVSMAIAAFAVAKDARTWKQQLAGAVLLTLAICGLHFTGMGAAVIVPDPRIVVPGQLLSTPVMITAVASLSALIVIGGLGTVLIEAHLRQSVQRRLLDAIPEGLAFYDSEDRCLLWNARYADLNAECAPLLKTGMRFESLFKAGIAAGHYPEAQGRETEWLEERMALRNSPGLHEQQLSDGRWLRIEERRTRDGGTISICVDITELKENAAQLEAALRAAEAASRSKSEFLANMSHELRTPLNGVLGIASVLSRTSLDQKQLEFVKLMESSASNLERLVSDVLDLARVEAGKVEIQRERFNLPEAVRAAAALFEIAAKEKGLGFRILIDSAAEGEVNSDPVRLRQIIVNLVSNAVKFTASGEIAVVVSRDDVEGPATIIEVRDTGVGFDDETKARVFSRFEQADSSVTRRFGGMGLGLAISRSLAELMDGTLEADSELGRGSTFRLRLPLRQETAQSPHTTGETKAA